MDKIEIENNINIIKIAIINLTESKDQSLSNAQNDLKYYQLLLTGSD